MINQEKTRYHVLVGRCWIERSMADFYAAMAGECHIGREVLPDKIIYFVRGLPLPSIFKELGLCYDQADLVQEFVVDRFVIVDSTRDYCAMTMEGDIDELMEYCRDAADKGYTDPNGKIILVDRATEEVYF